MTNNAAPSPIETISGVLDLLRDEVPSVAHYPTLATASPDGIGCARLVVLRGLHASKRWLWFNTHRHAQKVQHLRANPHAELALWIPEHAIQLRIRAIYQIVTSTTRSHDLQDLRTESWQAQPAHARALYDRPNRSESTGSTRKKSLKTLEKRQEIRLKQEKIGPPHPDFVVLLGKFYRIDALQLTQPHHSQYLHSWSPAPGAHWETAKTA